MDLPDDLRPTLDLLLDGARAALGEQLVGAYVVGSFALGCADAGSDVDVVVVTDGRPSDTTLEALRDLHGRLSGAGGWAERLDVSYADRVDLRSPMTLGRRWVHVDPGARDLAQSARDNTAHTRWVLRERGLVVAGPAPHDLLAEVTPAALRAEALGLARALAEDLEDDQSGYGDARSRGDVVLTSCRILHTAVHAEVVGTQDAADWALEHLDVAHRPVVEMALAARPRRGHPVDPASDPTLVAPTRAVVWDVVRLAGQAALEARDPG